MKVLFSLCLFFSQFCYSAQVVDSIMAIVNNEIITRSDFNTFNQKIKQRKPIDEILFLGQDPQKAAKNKKKLLDALINEKLLESEVKKNNLQITIERVEKEIRQIAKNYRISRKQLVKEIKKEGQNFAEYQNFIKTRLERQSLIEQNITSKIQITDEEIIQQYVKMNPSARNQVYEYTIAHILFSPNKKGGHNSAIERASKVLQKLRNGENFEITAKKHSEDPNFSPGGLLGTAKAGEFNSSVSNAISQLSPGEFSKVIKTPAGYSILKVVKKRMTDDPKFSKAKPQIRAILTERAFQKQFAQWIKEKRKLAFIRVNQ